MSVAQKDFGLWTGVDVRIPILKKLDVGVELQSRFESNVSQVERSFVSPYVKYELHKYVRLGLDYRLSNLPTGGGFFGSEYTHRTTLDIELKNLVELVQKKARLDLTARIRATHEVESGDLNNTNLRGRLKIAYNLPKTKLEPHVAAEVFYHFNDQISYTFSSVETRHRVSKYRLRAGLSYPLTKQHSVKLYYIVEPRIESTRTDFILGVGYAFKLKRIVD
jgi:hypothetical protein